MSSESGGRRPESAAEAVDRYVARTIPVRVDVGVSQTVLNLEEAEAILRAARSIALGDCVCRVEAKNCDAPVKTCLALDRTPAELADGEYARFEPVGVERALEILRASHEAGLVHMAFRKPGQPITEFCSCCSCCCWFFKELKRFEYRDAIVESSRVARHEADRCSGCGTCVARCHFDAWNPSAKGGVPSLDVARCFGCGVCVSSCPVGAISFVPRAAPSVG